MRWMRRRFLRRPKTASDLTPSFFVEKRLPASCFRHSRLADPFSKEVGRGGSWPAAWRPVLCGPDHQYGGGGGEGDGDGRGNHDVKKAAAASAAAAAAAAAAVIAVILNPTQGQFSQLNAGDVEPRFGTLVPPKLCNTEQSPEAQKERAALSRGEFTLSAKGEAAASRATAQLPVLPAAAYDAEELERLAVELNAKKGGAAYRKQDSL